MKAMMASRYVGWMAVRPLKFGNDEFEPGDRIPQKHLDKMRDPEVLVRTGQIKAVAKDLNKVPRYLRKDVMLESEAKAKILTPRASGQNGPIVLRHLVGTVHDPTSKAHKSHQRALEKQAEEQQAALTSEPVEIPEGTTYPHPAIPSIKVGSPAEPTGASAMNEEPVMGGPGEETSPEVEPPALNASTEDWAAYAVTSGQAAEEDVEGKTRTELIELYAPPEDDTETEE